MYGGIGTGILVFDHNRAIDSIGTWDIRKSGCAECNPDEERKEYSECHGAASVREYSDPAQNAGSGEISIYWFLSVSFAPI